MTAHAREALTMYQEEPLNAGTPIGALGEHVMTWRLWECTVDLARGRHDLAVRAYDTAANTQPEDPAPLWNFGGYMNNSWHRVTVQVR